MISLLFINEALLVASMLVIAGGIFSIQNYRHQLLRDLSFPALSDSWSIFQIKVLKNRKLDSCLQPRRKCYTRWINLWAMNFKDLLLLCVVESYQNANGSAALTFSILSLIS